MLLLCTGHTQCRDAIRVCVRPLASSLNLWFRKGTHQNRGRTDIIIIIRVGRGGVAWRAAGRGGVWWVGEGMQQVHCRVSVVSCGVDCEEKDQRALPTTRSLICCHQRSLPKRDMAQRPHLRSDIGPQSKLELELESSHCWATWGGGEATGNTPAAESNDHLWCLRCGDNTHATAKCSTTDPEVNFPP